MELIRNEITAMRLVLRSRQQTELEGVIPPPAGRSIASIADQSAGIFIDGCRIDAGKLTAEGRIAVSLIALDAGGECFAFTSESPFSSVYKNNDIEAGMLADCVPTLTSLRIRREADGRITLSGVIDLDVTVYAAGPMQVLGGVSGVPDLEIKTREVLYADCAELGRAVISLSNELSTDGADTVLSSGIALSVRDTAIESGGITVSGIASLSAIVKSAKGELTHITRNIPYRQNIAASGAADEVFAEAKLLRSSVTALGTDFSLISVDIEAEIRVFGITKRSLTLPLDAFSPTMNFNCVHKKTELLTALGGTSEQHTLRENLTVPEGMPDIFTAISASARAVITETRCSGGELCIEGLLPTGLLYRTESGELHSFLEDVPFAFTVAVPPGTKFTRIELGCACTVAGGSSRTAQAAYTLDASIRFLGVIDADLAVGLAEMNDTAATEMPNGFSGLIIYTVGSGETVFDAAMRFRVPSSRVRELNPDVSDSLAPGEKLLIVV